MVLQVSGRLRERVCTKPLQDKGYTNEHRALLPPDSSAYLRRQPYEPSSPSLKSCQSIISWVTGINDSGLDLEGVNPPGFFAGDRDLGIVACLYWGRHRHEPAKDSLATFVAVVFWG